MSSEAIKPVEEIRMGAVKAAIWKNMLDQGNNSRPIYNVSFQRLYRDAEGKWQMSGSFGRDDLLVLAQIAEHICARLRAPTNGTSKRVARMNSTGKSSTPRCRLTGRAGQRSSTN